MKIYRTYRFRLYPTARQELLLRAWQSSLRWLWNVAHEQRLMCWRSTQKKWLTLFEQTRELTDLRTAVPWLADAPRNASNSLLIELDRAWKRFRAGLAARPNWKRKFARTIDVVEANRKKWRLETGAVVFPKLGRIRAAVHRPVEGRPSSCRIRLDVDQWFAILVYEFERVDPVEKTGPILGIDRGITHLIADSDSRLVRNPRFLAQLAAKIRRAYAAVMRCRHGSKNFEKALIRYKRLHRKVRRRRNHFLHCESARIAENQGIVVVERINVRAMAYKNPDLKKALLDTGWSTLVAMLRYKLAKRGGRLVEVPAAYSSQTCAACLNVDEESRRLESFRCVACGHVDHADVNAAKVLKARLRQPGKTPDGASIGARRKARVDLRLPRRPLARTDHDRSPT